jgi:hypothetical protein
VYKEVMPAAENSPEEKENQPEKGMRRAEMTFTKNTAPVKLSEHISLDEFVSDSKQVDCSLGGLYSLKSLVYHLGRTASSGHYTADAVRARPTAAGGIEPEHDDKAPLETGTETEWVTFDDSKTSLTSLDKILSSDRCQQTAYMLLYTLD